MNKMTSLATTSMNTKRFNSVFYKRKCDLKYN